MFLPTQFTRRQQECRVSYSGPRSVGSAGGCSGHCDGLCLLQGFFGGCSVHFTRCQKLVEGKPRTPLSSRVATRVHSGGAPDLRPGAILQSPGREAALAWASLAQRSPASSVLAREGAGCGSVPTLQGPCGRSPKRRGSLRFLPPLEVRPSSVAPDPAESRPSQPEGKIGLPRANPRGRLRSPS